MRDYAKLQEAARRAGIDRTVVGIAVRRDARLLLLQRKPDDFQPDVWELPGGHIEDGESIEDAIARELEEETGWTLEVVLRFIDTFDYPGEAGHLTREWNFAVAARMDKELIHPEHQAYAWASADDYGQYPMTDEMRRTVARAFEDPR
jgi:8-oxo-dGTP diphosphatase